MKVLLILSIFLLSSCASYVNSFHKQIDNEQRSNKRRRYAPQGDARPIANPVTLNGIPNSNTQRNLKPGTQREYQKNRRYTAEDLKDNDKSGSLWSGEDSSNFLFVTNTLKRRGDIVILQVMESLKDKIQDELARNFPDRPTKKKKKKADDKEKETEEENIADKKPEDTKKVYDKISTSVVEQINKDYLLIRGRKEVMFKNFKRYFEIQAIVSQKDITSQDTVESLKILEPKIHVLRY